MSIGRKSRLNILGYGIVIGVLVHFGLYSVAAFAAFVLTHLGLYMIAEHTVPAFKERSDG